MQQCAQEFSGPLANEHSQNTTVLQFQRGFGDLAQVQLSLQNEIDRSSAKKQPYRYICVYVPTCSFQHKTLLFILTFSNFAKTTLEKEAYHTNVKKNECTALMCVLPMHRTVFLHL